MFVEPRAYKRLCLQRYQGWLSFRRGRWFSSWLMLFLLFNRRQERLRIDVYHLGVIGYAYYLDATKRSLTNSTICFAKRSQSTIDQFLMLHLGQRSEFYDPWSRSQFCTSLTHLAHFRRNCFECWGWWSLTRPLAQHYAWYRIMRAGSSTWQASSFGYPAARRLYQGTQSERCLDTLEYLLHGVTAAVPHLSWISPS